MDVNKILYQVQEILNKKFKNNFLGLVLFGSFAKKTQTENSDLDILLIFKELPQNRIKKLDLIIPFISKIETEHNIEINFILKEDKNLKINFLIADIAEYAKIILDKTGTISRLFNEIKKNYELGNIRKILNNDHYMLWINPELKI